ncbi:hypothetical protein BJV82DRAFT_713567 [Fennellomyces sp. T-0311]|nr:hypothetical protein BJV82DRAFT_713567 [Fennellomyces sp. T-0311]
MAFYQVTNTISTIWTHLDDIWILVKYNGGAKNLNPRPVAKGRVPWEMISVNRSLLREWTRVMIHSYIY